MVGYVVDDATTVLAVMLPMWKHVEGQEWQGEGKWIDDMVVESVGPAAVVKESSYCAHADDQHLCKKSIGSGRHMSMVVSCRYSMTNLLLITPIIFYARDMKIEGRRPPSTTDHTITVTSTWRQHTISVTSRADRTSRQKGKSSRHKIMSAPAGLSHFCRDTDDGQFWP
jgi:hypothetical protein